MCIRRFRSVNRLHSLHRISFKLQDRALEFRVFGDEIGVEVINLMIGAEIKALDTDGEACVTHAGLADWTLDTNSNGVREVGIGSCLVVDEEGVEVKEWLGVAEGGC